MDNAPRTPLQVRRQIILNQQKHMLKHLNSMNNLAYKFCGFKSKFAKKQSKVHPLTARMKSFKIQFYKKPNNFENYENNRLKFLKDEPATETELLLRAKAFRTLIKNHPDSMSPQDLLLAIEDIPLNQSLEFCFEEQKLESYQHEEMDLAKITEITMSSYQASPVRSKLIEKSSELQFTIQEIKQDEEQKDNFNQEKLITKKSKTKATFSSDDNITLKNSLTLGQMK